MDTTQADLGAIEPPIQIARLYLDANAFVQLRDLKDIPWRSAFPGVSSVRLIVIPAIVKELETMKIGQQDRLRNRSRTALKLIDEATRNNPMSLVLRQSNPEIVLVVERSRQVDWSAFPDLTPHKTDDLLVATALSDSGSIVFTHDRTPRINARYYGGVVLEPAEDWLLPEDKTAQQIEIDRLRKALAERHPTVTLALPDEPIVFRVPRVQPLDAGDSDAFVRRFLGLHPRTSFAPMGSLTSALAWNRPDQSAIDDYRSRYDAFVKRVTSFVDHIPELLNKAARFVSIDYVLRNESGQPASNLIVRISSVGAMLVDEPEQVIQSLLSTLPKPPKAPRGGWSQIDLSHLTRRLDMADWHEEERDPTAFYWLDRPHPPTDEATLKCQDFRSGSDFEGSMFLLPTLGLSQGTIAFDVHATNLREPVRKLISFAIEEYDADLTDEAIVSVYDRLFSLDDDPGDDE
ncbi:hypothetical protein [Mesorhizobium australicum]|uniref:PIN domain-containing protein n=1 Tax=Mesorhizobium australicum TaxID=536018 RepID=A0A1X7NYL0_9HYPH|nr:hypothetical protein [Mesorhizobium australicum]SMH42432.1 hypothetical protein SAMN02982922_2741 [Mesorhizobium australicum]